MSDATQFGFDDYLSPFTWRYGSREMRTLWSEAGKRRMWRRIWVALAASQADHGLVRADQVADLQAHVDDVDMERALAIEAQIHHDLMSEVKTFAEQCPVGGGVIHLGATSMDVEDNADALRIRAGLDLVLARLCDLLRVLTPIMRQYADVPTMGFTHLQPAEPTTIGYRLAQYGQDLAVDLADLRRLRADVRGKGIKGAAGTSASYQQLLGEHGVSAAAFEAQVMARLDLPPMLVATQTYARKQDYRVICGLASMGQSLYKMAADLRLLQSPPLGEFAEPFGAHQVGSSAMPFKRNPINAENINSLTRLLAALPRVAWDNAAHSYLERTLDDSANRRVVLPEGFLIADEALLRATRILSGLRVDVAAADRLLADYGTFAATERVLMELARRGGDRQSLHEIIRDNALAAWAELRAGRPNPLADRMTSDPRLLALATAEDIASWLDARDYTGDAAPRTQQMADAIDSAVADRD